MGNDQINLKKARILNNDAYAESIEEFSEKYCNTEDSLFAKTQTNAELFQSSGIHVCVRKRPLWQKEIDKGEFDCCTVGGSLSMLESKARDTMWLHQPKLRLDCKHRYVDHSGFPFDAVFSEKDDNNKVYTTTVAPLVETALTPGGRATVIAFGQTGSGKTYTMTHLSALAANDIFASLPKECTHVEVTAVEVQGSAVRDLLAEKVVRIKLLQDADKNLVMKGVVAHRATTAQELCTLLEKSYEKRVTEATGVNDTSSRSHAIYRITMCWAKEQDALDDIGDSFFMQPSKDEGKKMEDDGDDFFDTTAEEDEAIRVAEEAALVSIQAKESVHRVYGSTVVDISIPSPSFKLVSLSSPDSPLF